MIKLFLITVTLTDRHLSRLEAQHCSIHVLYKFGIKPVLKRKVGPWHLSSSPLLGPWQQGLYGSDFPVTVYNSLWLSPKIVNKVSKRLSWSSSRPGLNFDTNRSGRSDFSFFRMIIVGPSIWQFLYLFLSLSETMQR